MPYLEPENLAALEEAHHMANQLRFIELEKAVDFNTSVTQTLAKDTAELRKDTSELVNMWKYAEVVFRWIRRIGGSLIWIGKVGAGAAIVWAAMKYGKLDR